MRDRWKLTALAAAVAMAGCGDGTTSPGGRDPGNGAVERFEQLADSVDGAGDTPTADALRHAAQIVRLAGGSTPVTLTIDGEARAFEAVAEQIDFPTVVCTWPDTVPSPGTPDDAPPEPAPPGGEGGCEQVGSWSMRTLIAWEPEKMAEVVRIVADLGSTEVQPGVPDVMTGLPTAESGASADPVPATPDSAVGTLPGFLGQYLVSDVGIWFAMQGTQSNDLVSSSGACTEESATFDWARFECRAARFRFEFDMVLGPGILIDPMPVPAGSIPEGSHEISLDRTEIAGVRLEVVEWVPPAPPPVDTVPPPPPVDTVPTSPPVDPVPPPPPVDSTT